jgi:hypothetical protein
MRIISRTNGGPIKGIERARSSRRSTRPALEPLEQRLVLSTFTWTGDGDGTSWNDASNWSHPISAAPYTSTGTPSPGSNVVFPAISGLAAGTVTTVNQDTVYPSFPVASMTVAAPYTFTGNGITVGRQLSTTNSYSIDAGPTVATFLNAGLSLDAGVTINTDSGTTLELSNAGNSSNFQLSLQSYDAKAGAGTLILDTPLVTYPTGVAYAPIPFNVNSGTLTLGATATWSGLGFQLAPNATVTIADGVAATVSSITGSGLINLAGTTTAGDQTSLTVSVSRGKTDDFGGSIGGNGQFNAGGQGVLTTRSFDLGTTSTITAGAGTLNVYGSIAAANLQVDTGATFGGLGSWLFSGAVVFQTGSTYDVTLNGTAPASQYTQLVDSNSTSGINLGYATLAAVTGYQYQSGDSYQIVSAPVVSGIFQNVVNGTVILNGTIPFTVDYGTGSTTLTVQQSLTTTQLSSSGGSSSPGQPVTFTASVNTRTAPVASGSVTFMSGSTTLAVVPVNSSGYASFTTTTLPVGQTAVSAVYGGSGPNLSSTSRTLIHTVYPLATVTSLESSNSTLYYGQAVTLTATVMAGGMPVTNGTVTFIRGGRRIETVAISAAGTASIAVAGLSTGKTRFQAIYNGSNTELPSVSRVFTQTVSRAPTLTMLEVSTELLPNGRTRITLIATVSTPTGTGIEPTGTVQFRSGGKSLGTARVKGGVAALVLVKRKVVYHSFIASYKGSTKFSASESSQVALASVA